MLEESSATEPPPHSPCSESYLAHFLIVVVLKIQVIGGGHFIPSVVIVIRIWGQRDDLEFIHSILLLVACPLGPDSCRHHGNSKAFPPSSNL